MKTLVIGMLLIHAGNTEKVWLKKNDQAFSLEHKEFIFRTTKINSKRTFYLQFKSIEVDIVKSLNR